MVECELCKVKCFSQQELEHHDVLSHGAEEVKTIEGFTALKINEKSVFDKYVSVMDGTGKWVGSGWYIVYCKEDMNIEMIPIRKFIDMVERQAISLMTQMSMLRVKLQ